MTGVLDRRLERGRPPAEIDEIAGLTPVTIAEALEHMEQALEFFYRRDDYRSVFLHAYYLITLRVHRTIEEQGTAPRRLFRDPVWMSRLAGHFATLYFRSLQTFDKAPEAERAWKLAHGMAIEKTSTVIQDMLLGINAHIGYDLAQALCRNIQEHGDQHRADRLAVRKHDHDQANKILMRSIADIWRDVPRRYGGVLRVVDTATLGLDRHLAAVALKRYREGVWWHAMDLVAAREPGELEGVLETMNRRSTRIAELIAGHGSPLITTLNKLVRRLRRRSFIGWVPPGNNDHDVLAAAVRDRPTASTPDEGFTPDP